MRVQEETLRMEASGICMFCGQGEDVTKTVTFRRVDLNVCSHYVCMCA